MACVIQFCSLYLDQVSDGPMDYRASAAQQQPTLNLLGFLLNSLATALERATEDRYLLLSKVKDLCFGY